MSKVTYLYPLYIFLFPEIEFCDFLFDDYLLYRNIFVKNIIKT